MAEAVVRALVGCPGSYGAATTGRGARRDRLEIGGKQAVRTDVKPNP